MTFLDKIKNKLINYLISKKKKSKKIDSVSYKNSTNKYSMNSSCTMALTSATEEKKQKVYDEVKKIVVDYFNTPEKLILYMKARGCIVYRIRNAEKILSYISEEEGFISPLKGYKALFLNLIISICCSKNFNLSLSTKEMVIFDDKNTEIYTVARAFFKYKGFKYNLPGYDYNSQETFKRVYGQRNQSSPFAACSIKDMYACKDALARDMESINFTLELSKEYEMAKKAALKVTTEDGANI